MFLFSVHHFTVGRYTSSAYYDHGVRLCCRLPDVGVLSKRVNISSRKQRHAIARDYGFLVPKISVKFH